jgi:hypothetical protein
MVVMQVRRQVIASDIVASHGGLEQVFLHIPRQVGPQRKRGSAQQALELVRRVVLHDIGPYLLERPKLLGARSSD